MASSPTQREARFTALFEASYASVLDYARRRVRSEADAEEVAAEAFTVAWRRLDGLPLDAAELPWLYAVTRRVLANRWRGERRRGRLIDRIASFLPSGAHEPGATDGGTDVEPILQALARLSPGDRELLRLVAWEGLDHAEVASLLGTSVANVSVRLHRARRRLRAQMERLDLQDSEASGHSQEREHVAIPLTEEDRCPATTPWTT